MPKLSALSLDQFLEKLGSSEPAPGGGAAAALTVAQAAALGEMVARLNFKRSKNKKNCAALFTIRKKLMILLEKDAQAFTLLSRFKKEDRVKASYQSVLKKAAGVPLEICQAALEGLKLAAGEKTFTSAWLYSDLVESAILFEAGFSAARLNVEINLASMTDKKSVSKIKTQLNKISGQIAKLKKTIGSGK